MVRAVLDHLVVAAATLEQGEDYVETRLGARPLRGGRHVAMGTHNSLLKLGEKTYLEVIAIDPDGVAPGRARWFALDTAALRAEVAEAPRLIHWVARTDDIVAARRACPVYCGEIHAMARGAFEWRITIPADGRLPGRRPGAQHPGHRAARGCRRAHAPGEHPHRPRPREHRRPGRGPAALERDMSEFVPGQTPLVSRSSARGARPRDRHLLRGRELPG